MMQPAPGPGRSSRAAQLALVGLACFLFTLLFSRPTIAPLSIAPAALAGGLGLVAALRFGSVAPALAGVAVALAQIGCALYRQASLPEALVLGLAAGCGALIQAYLGAWLLARPANGAQGPRGYERSLLRFVFLGGAVPALIASLAQIFPAWLQVNTGLPDLARGYAAAWIDGVLGVVVFAPFSQWFLLPNGPALWRGRRAFLGLTSVLLFFGIWAARLGAATWEAQTLQNLLERQGSEITHGLQASFSNVAASLRSLRRAVEARPDMKAEEFDLFAQAALSDSPGLAALYFVQKSAGAGQGEAYAISLASPQAENARMLGMNVARESNVREALRRSAMTGQAVAVSGMPMPEGPAGRTNLLLFEPTYRHSHGTTPPSSGALLGFGVAEIGMDELVPIAIWKAVPEGLAFRLRNGNIGTPVYQYDAATGPVSDLPPWTGTVTLADGRWPVDVFPTAVWLRKHRGWTPLATGALMLLLATSLQLLVIPPRSRSLALQLSLEQRMAQVQERNEALQDSLETSDNLIRRVPVGLYRLRVSRTGACAFEFVSPCWCEQLGVSQEAVLADARAARQNLVADEKSDFLEGQRAASQGGDTYVWKGRCRCHGNERWLEVRATPSLLENGDVLWAGVQSDVTEHKLAEAHSRLLGQAVAQSYASVIITDIRGDLVFVNEAFARNTGYSREEVLGQNPRLLQSGQTPLTTYRQLWNTITSGKTWRGELLNRMKNGELFWEFVTISPVVDERQQVTHFIGVKENITARKAQDQELRQAKEAAEAASLAKSQFLATMSHEIRTPLNGILGMAELLLDSETDPMQMRDYARTILNSGSTLLSLLNDILDLSKVEAGKLVLRPASFAPGQIVEETAALFAGPARDKGLRVVGHWHGPAGRRYRADAMRIRQMLANLLSNAIKFTATGQIQLDAAEIRHEGNEATLSFSVTDTGIGIEADKLTSLFKPFSQVDGSVTRAYGGTGLGLSIVSRLADLMGGQVGVDSEPGRGSRFWFRIQATVELPGAESRSEERPTRVPSRSALPEPQPGGHRPSAPAVATSACDMERLSALLGILGPLLEQQKYDAVAQFRTLQKCVAGTALEDEVQAAAGAMAELRFGVALEQLQKLAKNHGLEIKPS